MANNKVERKKTGGGGGDKREGLKVKAIGNGDERDWHNLEKENRAENGRKGN